jgi:hypothetical protein
MNDHKSTDNSSPGPHKSGNSMGGMMAMMMAMCIGVILLFLVIPAVGFPFGLAIALGAGALMFVLHARFMPHS